MQIIKFAKQPGKSALVAGVALALTQTVQANDDLDKLYIQNANWVMQTKDY